MPNRVNGLTDVELEMLRFAGKRWNYRGARDQAVREQFDMNTVRFDQKINELINRPEALAAEPMIVRRLRRLRTRRRPAALDPYPR